MTKIVILHVYDAANKGDYAILKSEINFLKNFYKDAKLYISANYPESLKIKESYCEVGPSLIDIEPWNQFELGTLQKTILFISPLLLFIQLLASLVSIILIRIKLDPIYRRCFLKKIQEADIVISTGGGFLHEVSTHQQYPLSSKLYYLIILCLRTYEILIAKKIFHKFVVVFPQTIGPFRSKIGKFIATTFLNNVDIIFLREPYSKKLIKNLKIKTPIHVVADIAFLLKKKKQKKIKKRKIIIGVSPRHIDNIDFEKYVASHAKVLDYYINKDDADVLFLPSSIMPGRRGDDLEICYKIIARMENKKKTKIINSTTLEGYISMLGSLDLIIATRMHPSIFALLNNVLPVLIIYDQKQVGLLKQLNLTKYGIQVKKLTYLNLFKKVGSGLDNRHILKKNIEEKVNKLQNKTKSIAKFLPQQNDEAREDK